MDQPVIDRSRDLVIADIAVHRYLKTHPWQAHLERDLFSAACQGICEAKRRYDASIATWITFAQSYANGFVKHEARQCASGPRLPRILRNVCHGQELPKYQPVLSLDVEVDGLSLHGSIPDEKPSPEERMHCAEVRALLAELTEKEREVIERRFGIGREEETFEAIGRSMGTSKQRVQQIEAKALRRLRTVSERQGDRRGVRPARAEVAATPLEAVMKCKLTCPQCREDCPCYGQAP